MPWISVTTGPDLTDEAVHELSVEVAAAAAAALGLPPADVIVLVTRAAGISAPGAVATVSGRRRGDAAEADLAAAVRAQVGTALGVDPDLVDLSRL